jgi:ADP-heptose:LPS heptosyltransferase
MEAADLAPLAAIPNIFWFSLQKGDRAAEAADFTFPLLDLTHDLTDFAETAALVANLDLVISVDTSIIHLAGALGVPGWLLLPNIPDWRWLLDREDSPWYPSVRLFRQGPDRAWAPVIGRVGQRLHQTARVN